MSVNNLSERKIEIDGKEYTLFLNRKGIVAWEKFTLDNQKNIKKLQEQMQTKYKDLREGKVEINDDTDPFADIDELERDLNGDFDESDKMLEKFYWIMLYTNHKLSLNKVHDLYLKAKKEYGFDQLDTLATQMIDDVNTNPDKEFIGVFQSEAFFGDSCTLGRKYYTFLFFAHTGQSHAFSTSSTKVNGTSRELFTNSDLCEQKSVQLLSHV